MYLLNKLKVSKESLTAAERDNKVIHGLVRVAGRNKVRVAACSVQAVEVTGPRYPEETEVIVESIAHLPKGLIVGTTLTTALKGRMYIQVVNPSVGEVWLLP